MKITCPECGFSREVPENKIPDTAIRATCPKCGVKFSFRKPVPEPEFLLEDEVDPEEGHGQPHDSLDSPADFEDVRKAPQLDSEVPKEFPTESPDVAPDVSGPEDVAEGSSGGWTEESYPTQSAGLADGVSQELPEASFEEEPVRQNNLSRLTRGLDPEEPEGPVDETGQETDPYASEVREGNEGRIDSSGRPVASHGDTEGSDMRDDRDERSSGNGGDIWQKLESMDIPDDPGPDGADGDTPTPKRKRRDSHRAQDSQDVRGREDFDENPVVDVPWERLDRYGFFGGLTQTVKRIMFNPRLFFETMPLRGGMLRPLAFYMLIYLFETLCQYVWGMAGFTTSGLFTGTQMGADMAGSESMLPVNMEAQLLVFVYPVLFTLLLFAGSGINHLFLLAVQSGKGGFEGTFRALAYSSAPMVLSFIPVVGPMIGAFWSFVITFIAFKSVHRTTYVRVFIAFMLPIVILLGMSLLVAVGANHSV
jgi:hypothetical protein